MFVQFTADELINIEKKFLNGNYGVCRGVCGVFILLVLNSLTRCFCVSVYRHTCLFCSLLKLSEDRLKRGSHSGNNAAEECRPEGRRLAVRFVQIVQRCQTVLTQGLVT